MEGQIIGKRGSQRQDTLHAPPPTHTHTQWGASHSVSDVILRIQGERIPAPAIRSLQVGLLIFQGLDPFTYISSRTTEYNKFIFLSL